MGPNEKTELSFQFTSCIGLASITSNKLKALRTKWLLFIYRFISYLTIQVSSGLHLLALKPFELHFQLLPGPVAAVT